MDHGRTPHWTRSPAQQHSRSTPDTRRALGAARKGGGRRAFWPLRAPGGCVATRGGCGAHGTRAGAWRQPREPSGAPACGRQTPQARGTSAQEGGAAAAWRGPCVSRRHALSSTGGGGPRRRRVRRARRIRNRPVPTPVAAAPTARGAISYRPCHARPRALV